MTLVGTFAVAASPGCTLPWDLPLPSSELPDPSVPAGTPIGVDPPSNPSLADGPWSASHRGSYAQGSSSLAGPANPAAIESRHATISDGAPITQAISAQYDNGDRVVWLAPTGLTRSVYKLLATTLEQIDVYDPREREGAGEVTTVRISGAYSLVDADNHFILARQRGVEVYGDAVEGDAHSGIALLRRFDIDDAFFCGANDKVVGMVMSYDDYFAFVTERGVVGMLPRDPEAMRMDTLVRYSVTGEQCEGAYEEVSNSLAADENGGVYFVSSRAAYRLNWDGGSLSLGWRTPYKSDEFPAAIRLGEGSGSTPSLMGVGDDEDRFVVITDGQQLMHLVLMWRDEIPDDWQGIAPGRDRRIACEIPVRFGDPHAFYTVSEQSVLVRGYSSVLVNNTLSNPLAYFFIDLYALRRMLIVLDMGKPGLAPHGIERIDWLPEERRCQVVWSNPTISIPNGIPTLSDPDRLIYGVGVQNGVWGLQAVDFDSGEEDYFVAGSECEPGYTAALPLWVQLVVVPVLAELKNSCENSTYAATEIGADGAIYTGTFFGISRYASN
ncbi:MAG: hypothetical protein R3A47_05700 [Polyangiales bacterium]